MIPPSGGCRFGGFGGRVGRGDLAGAAHLELVSGVLQLRPEDAMFEAMLRGWKAQQASRGLRGGGWRRGGEAACGAGRGGGGAGGAGGGRGEAPAPPRERLVRRFLEFT